MPPHGPNQVFDLHLRVSKMLSVMPWPIEKSLKSRWHYSQHVVPRQGLAGSSCDKILCWLSACWDFSKNHWERHSDNWERPLKGRRGTVAPPSAPISINTEECRSSKAGSNPRGSVGLRSIKKTEARLLQRLVIVQNRDHDCSKKKKRFLTTAPDWLGPDLRLMWPDPSVTSLFGV